MEDILVKKTAAMFTRKPTDKRLQEFNHDLRPGISLSNNNSMCSVDNLMQDTNCCPWDTTYPIPIYLNSEINSRREDAVTALVFNKNQFNKRVNQIRKRYQGRCKSIANIILIHNELHNY